MLEPVFVGDAWYDSVGGVRGNGDADMSLSLSLDMDDSSERAGETLALEKYIWRCVRG